MEKMEEDQATSRIELDEQHHSGLEAPEGLFEGELWDDSGLTRIRELAEDHKQEAKELIQWVSHLRRLEHEGEQDLEFDLSQQAAALDERNSGKRKTKRTHRIGSGSNTKALKVLGITKTTLKTSGMRKKALEKFAPSSFQQKNEVRDDSKDNEAAATGSPHQTTARENLVDKPLVSCIAFKSREFMFNRDKQAHKREEIRKKGYLRRRKRKIAFKETVKMRIFNKKKHEKELVEATVPLGVPADEFLLDTPDLDPKLQAVMEDLEFHRGRPAECELKLYKRTLKGAADLKHDSKAQLAKLEGLIRSFESEYKKEKIEFCGTLDWKIIATADELVFEALKSCLTYDKRIEYCNIFLDSMYLDFVKAYSKLEVITTALEGIEANPVAKIGSNAIFESAQFSEVEWEVKRTMKGFFAIFNEGFECIESVETSPGTGEMRPISQYMEVSEKDVEEFLTGKVVVRGKKLKGNKSLMTCALTQKQFLAVQDIEGFELYEYSRRVNKFGVKIPRRWFGRAKKVISADRYEFLHDLFLAPMKTWLNLRTRFCAIFFKFFNHLQIDAVIAGNFWLLNFAENYYLPDVIKNASILFQKYKDVFDLSLPSYLYGTMGHGVRLHKKKKRAVRGVREDCVAPFYRTELTYFKGEQKEQLVKALHKTTFAVDGMSFLISTGARLDIVYSMKKHYKCPASCSLHRGKLLALMISIGNQEMVNWLIRQGVSPDLTFCSNIVKKVCWGGNTQDSINHLKQVDESSENNDNSELPFGTEDSESAELEKPFSVMLDPFETHEENVRMVMDDLSTDIGTDINSYFTLRWHIFMERESTTPIEVSVTKAISDGSFDVAKTLITGYSKKPISRDNFSILRKCLPIVEKLAKIEYMRMKIKSGKKYKRKQSHSTLSGMSGLSKISVLKRNFSLFVAKTKEKVAALKSTSSEELKFLEFVMMKICDEFKDLLDYTDISVACKSALLYEALKQGKWDVVRFLAPQRSVTEFDESSFLLFFSKKSKLLSRRYTNAHPYSDCNRSTWIDAVVATSLNKAIDMLFKEALDFEKKGSDNAKNGHKDSNVLRKASMRNVFLAVYFCLEEYDITLEEEQWRTLTRLLFQSLEQFHEMRPGDRDAIALLMENIQVIDFFGFRFLDSPKTLLSRFGFEHLSANKKIAERRRRTSSEVQQRLLLALAQNGYNSLFRRFCLYVDPSEETLKKLLFASAVKRPHFSLSAAAVEFLRDNHNLDVRPMMRDVIDDCSQLAIHHRFGEVVFSSTLNVWEKVNCIPKQVSVIKLLFSLMAKSKSSLSLMYDTWKLVKKQKLCNVSSVILTKKLIPFLGYGKDGRFSEKNEALAAVTVLESLRDARAERCLNVFEFSVFEEHISKIEKNIKLFSKNFTVGKLDKYLDELRHRIRSFRKGFEYQIFEKERRVKVTYKKREIQVKEIEVLNGKIDFGGNVVEISTSDMM